jgi:CheY-like chemotaxis protein
VDALETGDYDLVLMDCMMPVMGGFGATAIIRDPASRVRNHSIPIIALTANAMQEDKTKCLAAGMDDYLAKPLEIADLLVLLEKWLWRSKAGEAVETSLAPPTLKEVFKRDEIVRRNLGDLALSAEVANEFIKSAPEYIESIRNAVAAEDAIKLLQAAHKLKGSAANLSLQLLSETSRMIESEAGRGDFESARLMMPDLELQFKLAEDALRETIITPQRGDNHESSDCR